ncbi:AraC family transcriptional regulator [Mesorhizobium sp. KR9-304]|uniref:AraC family transcriptional regulator n=1 Tax=Mesorhizobium sp. KR9-304 TaxID=3156614 RepID=UPI0032B3B3E6
MSDSLHLENAATLTTSSMCKSGMGFVELKGDRDDVGVSERVRDDAFLVAVQLKECPDFDLYADHRLFPHRNFVAGSITIYDLRTNLLYDLRPPKAGDLRDTFHAIDFYLPCRALDALAEDAGSPRIDELRHEPGKPFRDSVVNNLVRSIEPTLAVPPEERNAIFIDHVAMALATHVAHTYGGMQLHPVSTTGRLARWQERRAKELLAANLQGGITLTELSGACGLSIRHFTRAFRGSTGMSPNAWLQHHRVERAKGMLTNSNRVLADVALDCGFADQSHFSRTFQRMAGVSPGAWRRLFRR